MNKDLHVISEVVRHGLKNGSSCWKFQNHQRQVQPRHPAQLLAQHPAQHPAQLQEQLPVQQLRRRGRQALQIDRCLVGSSKKVLLVSSVKLESSGTLDFALLCDWSLDPRALVLCVAGNREPARPSSTSSTTISTTPPTTPSTTSPTTTRQPQQSRARGGFGFGESIGPGRRQPAPPKVSVSSLTSDFTYLIFPTNGIVRSLKSD